MKKIVAIALVLVLTVGVLAGCRSNNQQDTSAPSTETTTRPTTAATTAPSTAAPTTMPTTQATQPSTDMTGPDMGDMIPGTDDTIDPTNGANHSTNETTAIH